MSDTELEQQLESFKRYKRMYNTGKITQDEFLDLLKTLELKNKSKIALEKVTNDINKKKELEEYIEIFNKLTIIRNFI